MNAQLSDAAQTILRTVERYRSLGYRETQQGVRLFGSAPHAGPRAWLHAIPAGLTEQQIGELTSSIGAMIPSEYRKLLNVMNGAHLFLGALALYGLRPAADRKSVDTAFLPFDVVDANSLEKPRWLQGDLFVVGGYRFDGSLLVVNDSNGRVERFERDSGVMLNRWPSLREFASSEMQRLDGLHDATGKLVAARDALVPTSNTNRTYERGR